MRVLGAFVPHSTFRKIILLEIATFMAVAAFGKDRLDAITNQQNKNNNITQLKNNYRFTQQTATAKYQIIIYFRARLSNVITSGLRYSNHGKSARLRYQPEAERWQAGHVSRTTSEE